MGRELKRVALDYDYKIDELWEGYVNPHYVECPHCEAGHSKLYTLLQNMLYQLPSGNELVIEFIKRLSGKKPNEIFGHDSMNYYSATCKLLEITGYPEDANTCPECEGHGIAKDKYKEYSEWEELGPPAGEGYQLWGTTSEGTPLTPVFKKLGDLCIYASKHCTTFGYETATVEEWEWLLSKDLFMVEKGNMVFI